MYIKEYKQIHQIWEAKELFGDCKERQIGKGINEAGNGYKLIRDYYDGGSFEMREYQNKILVTCRDVGDKEEKLLKLGFKHHENNPSYDFSESFTTKRTKKRFRLLNYLLKNIPVANAEYESGYRIIIWCDGAERNIGPFIHLSSPDGVITAYYEYKGIQVNGEFNERIKIVWEMLRNIFKQ